MAITRHFCHHRRNRITRSRRRHLASLLPRTPRVLVPIQVDALDGARCEANGPYTRMAPPCEHRRIRGCPQPLHCCRPLHHAARANVSLRERGTYLQWSLPRAFTRGTTRTTPRTRSNSGPSPTAGSSSASLPDASLPYRSLCAERYAAGYSRQADNRRNPST